MLATGGRYQATEGAENVFQENDFLGQHGVERKLGNTLGMGSMALTAMYPVALNNPGRLGDFYNSSAKNLINAGKAVGVFNQYKNIIGFADPIQGQNYAQSTTSPRNILNTAVDIASFTNPVTALLNMGNKQTIDRENPYGTIPLVSDFAEMVGDAGTYLNKTPVGKGLKAGTGFIYKNTLQPIAQSAPGRFFYDLAKIPLSFTQGVVNSVSEAYEAIDRTLFNNYLPFGADSEKPETLKYNPSFNQFIQDIDNLVDKVTTSDKEAFVAQHKEMFPEKSEIELDSIYDWWTDAVAEGNPYQENPNLFYEERPDLAPSGYYYNKKLKVPMPTPEGYQPDPNGYHSENGLVQVPDDQIYDPHSGTFYTITDGDFDPLDLIPEGITNEDVSAFFPPDKDPLSIAKELQPEPTPEPTPDPVSASIANKPVRDPTLHQSINDFGSRAFLGINPIPEPTQPVGSYNLFGYRPF